ncbi:MAG: hypothetical protein QNJ16_09895 [Rhodobacter sp.]|nr:hypothetical protein [Rhodobacter sp.]
MSKAIEKLAALAGMLRDAELSKLAARAAERRKIEGEISELRQQRHALSQLAEDGPAKQVHAEALWQCWAETRMKALSADAAQAAARSEAQIPVARRAFGRAQALQKIASATRAVSRRD